MKLSITSRLTLTTALLTMISFVVAGIVIYTSVASGIRTESINSAQTAARSLGFAALYQWDHDLLVEYKSGEDPFGVLVLNTPHWALVRGDGGIAITRGELFARGSALPALGTSRLLLHEDQPYRTASVPLFGPPRDELENLPGPVREAVRLRSPGGVFLFAKPETVKGTSVMEVAMLEPEHVRELKVAADGAIVEEDLDKYDEVVPPDLTPAIAGEKPVEKIAFSSWRAYNEQLIAIVAVKFENGEAEEIAVNRLGERFLRNTRGDIVGPEPASRLWIVTAMDASGEVFTTRRLLATLAFGLPVLWSVVVLVGWYVTRRAMAPVKRIVETVQRIEVARLDERLPVGAVEDELHRISATINNMLDRIKAGYTRERQFTGDASHELRGPLAKIIADIDVALSKEREATEYRETLLRCRAYSRGLQHLVESLLWLARLDSRREPLDVRSFELTDLAAQTVRLLPEDEASRVKLELPGARTVVMARGVPDLVGVMLQNLLQNALRYSPAGSPVELRIAAENGTARIEVEDRGEGIPEDQIARVFSRFYRVDKSRSRETGGCGLGLAIVNEIALAHGTSVSLANMPGGGLRASFCLAVDAAASGLPQRRDVPWQPGGPAVENASRRAASALNAARPAAGGGNGSACKAPGA